MHYEILDKKRIDLLPTLAKFRDNFYLAGGTGLALQIGHRDSIDFDFFTPDHFDTRKLYDQVREVFASHKIEKTQEEKDTLSIILDEELKVSFLSYPYPVIDEFVHEAHINIASIRDIACMKLGAITSRSVLKDYVDLYFIFNSHLLPDILACLEKKMPDQDQNLVLKCLTYFEDIIEDKIVFKNGTDVPFDTIKKFLVEEVKKIYTKLK
ncbi:MAG: nucleotidyl transferase AbiEii/AbiGii toxin family protein [Candidatus Paceibacterota bacterium]|jgi:hypothetical protein